jgi:riboflavin transporter FmnP
MRRTVKISLTALFGSLAIVFSILRLEASFPLLPWLKFDLAEIPSMLAYFTCGLGYGILAEAIHYLGLVARGSNFLDAFMKFLAVASMMVGYSLFTRTIYKAVSGIVVRVVVMSIMNYVYFYFLDPNFLSYALKFAGSIELLYGYTAVFNIIHGALTIGVSLLLVREIEKRIKLPPK